MRLFPVALILVGAAVAVAGADVGSGSDGAPPPGMFVTADRCVACHNALVTPAGQDISIGTDWRPSMMANAARDPYWHAAVRRETLVRPSA